MKIQQLIRGTMMTGGQFPELGTLGRLKVPPGAGTLFWQVMEGNRSKDGHPTPEGTALGRTGHQ